MGFVPRTIVLLVLLLLLEGVGGSATTAALPTPVHEDVLRYDSSSIVLFFHPTARKTQEMDLCRAMLLLLACFY